MENKELKKNEMEKKLQEEKVSKDQVSAELNDEMLGNVSGGESQNKVEVKYSDDVPSALTKHIIR